jgi:hypothetical protein
MSLKSDDFAIASWVYFTHELAKFSKIFNMAFMNILNLERMSAVLIPAFLTINALWLITLAIHRLYLSPLANFPGPKLAALTSWYEFYYDAVKGGQFTFHIQELHKQYGTKLNINYYLG